MSEKEYTNCTEYNFYLKNLDKIIKNPNLSFFDHGIARMLRDNIERRYYKECTSSKFKN